MKNMFFRFSMAVFLIVSLFCLVACGGGGGGGSKNPVSPKTGIAMYTITYKLDGGTVAVANPTIYGTGSDTITLNNPTKDGFNFTGWTGSNGNVPQTTVTISKGSEGNKEYTANWIKKVVMPDEIVFNLAENVTLKMKKVFNQDYYAGIYEVTQAQYKAVMNNVNPSKFVGDNKPVEQVSWNDIMADKTGFIAKINTLLATQLANKTNGYAFNLPTKEQAEYTYRADSNGDGEAKGYFYGKQEVVDATNIDNYCWNYDNCSETTHDVGTKLPNKFGFYDYSGNVSEWVLEKRDIGGDWGVSAEYCQYYSGMPLLDPSEAYATLGFRLFLLPPAQ